MNTVLKSYLDGIEPMDHFDDSEICFLFLHFFNNTHFLNIHFDDFELLNIGTIVPKIILDELQLRKINYRTLLH